ncbi:MAG: DUF2723 domain-containing protein [Nanoarchaeota archaeon]|nr:DUF2723 domain-containing protein [Nanoarchaeota archaeon]
MDYKEFTGKFLPLIILFTSFSTYLLTMAPSIYWGDSPELVSAAYTMGIAHPSGYPLYVLFGKLFTVIPIGTIAYRLNIMSAFFASFAVMLLYFVALKITKSRLAALFSSLTLGFSYTLWTQATIAEVYTLNAFFLVALILILLKWAETMKQRYLYAFSFVFGLGLTNHLTLILALPAFAFFIIGHIRKLQVQKVIQLRSILIMLIFFVIGISLYIYLPLRAAQNPFINWGNPISLKFFINHVLGTGYGHYFVPQYALLNFAKAFVYLLMQFPLTLPFAFIGIKALAVRHKTILALVSLITLFNITYNIIYNIQDIIVYYIPTYIIFSLFIGVGLWHSLLLINAKFYAIRKYIYYALVTATLLLVVSNAFLLFFIFKGEQGDIDRSESRAADNYAKFMLAYAKPNSIITGDSDNSVFPLIYYQAVEGKRKDLIVLYKGILTESAWYADQLKQRYPERNLIIEGSKENISVVFNVPSILYDVLIDPSLVETFNATLVNEYQASKITATPA